MTEPNQWNMNGDWLPTTTTQAGAYGPESLRGSAAWAGGSKIRNLRVSRRLRFGIIVAVSFALVCCLSAWIGWATTAIQPVSRTKIVLLSTDYQDNLLIAPNIGGDRVVGRLAALCDQAQVEKSLSLQLVDGPIEFIDTDSIDQAFENLNGQPVLMYVSAHGLSTANGPVLIPRGSQSTNDAIFVKDLLARFAKLPPDTSKVLVLDACHISTDHRWGILHNDFAHQMRGLNKQIESIENLSVILDADTDQKAWVDPIVGASVFGHAFIEGITGTAEDLDRDGWLDVQDVFTYTQIEVEKWADTRVGMKQTPVLLPEGPLGRKRTRRMTLRQGSADKIADPPAMISNIRPEKIDVWWSEVDRYNSRIPHPAIASPLVWDRFIASVLRYESFELNGSRAAADAINKQLIMIQYELDHGRPLESASARGGIIAPLAIGAVPPADIKQKAGAIVEKMMDIPHLLRADAWRDATKQSPSSYETAQLRRQMTEIVVERIIGQLGGAASLDRTLLSDAVVTVNATLDPLQPDTTLVTLLQLLDRDLPDNFVRFEDKKMLARLLQAWKRCDCITSRDSFELTHLDAIILPWVTKPLFIADTQRRLAFDLLMGDSDSRDRAVGCLDLCEQAYADVDAITETIGNAQTRLCVGWNQLAWLSNSIESMSLIDPDLSQTTELVSGLECAFLAAERLADRLARPHETDDHAASNIYEQVAAMDAQFSTAMDAIAIPLSKWQTEGRQSDEYLSLVRSLDVPGGSGAERRQAWERLRKVANKPAITENEAEFQANVRPLAKLLGRIALAVWTERDFNQLGGDGSETYAQMRHRLDIFAVESDWRNSLAGIGDQIAERYYRATARLISDKISHRQLDADSTLARRFDGLLPNAADHAIDGLRVLQAVPYFVISAGRAIKDGLASIDPHATPQYAAIAAVLIDDASRYGTDEPLEELHKKIGDAGTLAMQTDPGMHWTTERQQTIPIELSRQGELNPGFVTISAKVQDPLTLLSPLPNTRSCRPIQERIAKQSPVLPAKINSTLIQLAITPEALAKSNDVRSNVQIQGYFRGKRLQSTINLHIQATPTQHAISHHGNRSTAENGAKLAVRSPAGLTGSSFQGSVAIVIDCSGSMGALRGEAYNTDTKYAQSLAAVKTLLAEIPRGVQLSIWTFGQAGKDASKTVQPAEQTIRRVLAPIQWDPKDQANIADLISTLDYPATEPWNESPLVAALISASRDFNNEQDRFRSIIAITDGLDNRIETDPTNNPGGATTEQIIRQSFSGTGIVLNVIGFRVESHESQATKDILSVVETLMPPGRYVQVDKADELTQTLRGSLANQLQYEILTSGSSKPVAVINESPSQGAIRWTETSLPAGVYTVRLKSSRSGEKAISETIELSADDRLLLQRTVDHTLVKSSEQSDIQKQNLRSTGNYQLSLSELQAPAFKTQRHQLTLATNAQRPLRIDVPGDLWIEAYNADKKRLPCRWSRDVRYSGLAYLIDTFEVGMDPVSDIKILVNPNDAIPVGVLKRGRDFAHVADLAPARWQDSVGEIRLREATIETWKVPGKDGKESLQDCFVMRIDCPAGSSYRLRPRGISFDGYDEQVFADAACYTYRAWPLTIEQVDRDLSGLELISVDQTNESAQRAGMMLHFECTQPTQSNTHSMGVSSWTSPTIQP